MTTSWFVISWLFSLCFTISNCQEFSSCSEPVKGKECNLTCKSEHKEISCIKDPSGIVVAGCGLSHGVLICGSLYYNYTNTNSSVVLMINQLDKKKHEGVWKCFFGLNTYCHLNLLVHTRPDEAELLINTTDVNLNGKSRVECRSSCIYPKENVSAELHLKNDDEVRTYKIDHLNFLKTNNCDKYEYEADGSILLTEKDIQNTNFVECWINDSFGMAVSSNDSEWKKVQRPMHNCHICIISLIVGVIWTIILFIITFLITKQPKCVSGIFRCMRDCKSCRPVILRIGIFLSSLIAMLVIVLSSCRNEGCFPETVIVMLSVLGIASFFVSLYPEIIHLKDRCMKRHIYQEPAEAMDKTVPG